ncbi:MAG: tetratricopeptide repeat protein [Chloroflexia bacterium]
MQPYLDEWPQAYTLLEETLALRRALGDTRGMGIALSNLGGLAVLLKDYARAVAIEEESLTLFAALGDQRARVGSLSNLAEASRNLGDSARARALYAEMIELLEALGDSSALTIGLEGIAALDVANARAEYVQRAVRLLGASEVLREASGTSLSPRDQAEYKRVLADARDQLGDEVFAQAWTVGREMTVQDAVRDAATPPHVAS